MSCFICVSLLVFATQRHNDRSAFIHVCVFFDEGLDMFVFITYVSWIVAYYL